MKPLYVSSILTFSGKTAVCLGLGLRMQVGGLKVGYMKPVSTQPWYMEGRVLDQDAEFVCRTLGLDRAPWELSPVVITDQLLEQAMRGELDRDLMAEIMSACAEECREKDVMILEGGSNLREGTALGVRSVEVARAFDAAVLMVIRWDGALHVADAALSSRYRYQQMGKDLLIGVVINKVPKAHEQFTREVIVPFLEKRGVPVFGVLPEERHLSAISIETLVHALGAEVLSGKDRGMELVEELVVGAMSAEEALPRFRRYRNKAVITGGDRSDVQLAALQTSTAVLILTGNIRPNPSVVGFAEDADVPVLVVPDDTMTAVEKIEPLFGKTRLGQAEKLSRFQALMAEHFDYDRLIKTLGL